jgi:hypothetical protein
MDALFQYSWHYFFEDERDTSGMTFGWRFPVCLRFSGGSNTPLCD